MKLLSVYYGTDQYDYEAEPYHCVAKYRITSLDVDYHKEKAHVDLQNGKCYWYILVVTDVNPTTGATTTEHFYESLPQKEKIVLNAAAKGKHSPVAKKKNKLVMDPAVAMPNLFDGFFAVPAGQAVTIVPAPEELEF